MKTLKELGYPQDTNTSEFPDGQIRNKTETVTGTPVVREVYGDILTNIYKILRNAGIAPNELEDSETNGYQLLNALKIFANELNDLNQVVTVGATSLDVNFDFDSLPDNYVFIGKLTDNYVKNITYTFSGTGVNTYSINASENIKLGSKVLIALNQSQIEVTSLESVKDYDALLTPFNGLLGFNSTDKNHYLSDGFILTNVPESSNVQQTIRVNKGDNTIIVYDAIIHKDKLIVMAKPSSAFTYDFYVFDLNNFNVVLASMNYTQAGNTDFLPTLYADENFIYLSNNGNKNVNDLALAKIEFDETLNTLTDVSVISLESSFQKTSNYFIKNDAIFTLINGNLNEFTFAGSKDFRLFINNVSGQVFTQFGQTYFTSGEIAFPWNV
jgi:hypothetical protein